MTAVTSKKSTLEQLVDELFDAYPDDPSAPGVTIAKIKDHPRPRYYVSVVRHGKPLGEGRSVVTSARGMDLAFTIREVAKQWRDLSKKNR
jgi:CubicO group peptidase (beta-lactamase class C family)